MLGPEAAPDHALAERRSLAYHREIAARLRDDSVVLARARARVSDWLASGAVARFYAEAWCDLLARSEVEIERALCDDSESMRMLRQVTPFAGALPPRERWRIWRAARSTP